MAVRAFSGLKFDRFAAITAKFPCTQKRGYYDTARAKKETEKKGFDTPHRTIAPTGYNSGRDAKNYTRNYQ
jgi:hypothetical protein